MDGGASAAGGSGDAGGAEGRGGEERQADSASASVAVSPSSPMKDLVLEPPALAMAGAGQEGDAAVVEEQYLDHVLEALVRVRGIVLPRVRCEGWGLVLGSAGRRNECWLVGFVFWWCGYRRWLPADRTL